MADNSETSHKELAALEDRLNRIAGSGAKISQLSQVSPGQYQMFVHLDPNTPSATLFGDSPDKIKGLVKERKLDPNSLLGKARFSEKASALQQNLYLAGLKDIEDALQKGKDLSKVTNEVTNFNKEIALLNQRFRDTLRPSVIDNRVGTADAFEAIELYKRSEQEYKRTGIYGTCVDLLSNFSATGFHNEHKDLIIKYFYDSWSNDVKFHGLITSIFNNLFKYSVAHILPAYGSYEQHADGISSIPGKSASTGSERARVLAVFDRFFKEKGLTLDRDRLHNILDSVESVELGAVKGSNIPVAYTILDPKYVIIESSGVYGAETVTVKSKGLAGIKSAVDRAKKGTLSKAEKERLKLVPSKIRQAAEKGDDYVDLDNFIETIYLRKNDFESYSLPRGSRAFDSFDYKEELKKADFATLDGIFNYILKVTVGDKDNPVTDISTLDSLAEAFNTPQKAFTVVWNHTLNIEKITTDEIGEILGKAKYEPVNEDITAALGITRALIDGESVSAAAGVLSSKALQSEISATRKRVEEWIYKQYRMIAKGSSFDSYPVVRWKQAVITTDGDAVTRASWMQLVDRQLVSWETAQQAMDIDPEAELEKLRRQREIMLQEGIGIVGSPFQQTTPSGDQGRPKAQPSGAKPSGVKTKQKPGTPKPKAPSQQTVERSREVTPRALFSDFSKLTEKEKLELVNLIISSADSKE